MCAFVCTSTSVKFLLAGKSVLGDAPALVPHSSPWFGHKGGRRPRLIRFLHNMRMVVWRFLSTKADILLLGSRSECMS